MDAVISRIVDEVGINRDLASKAVGIMLGLVKADGDKDLVHELMLALPGAEQLADAESGGGLLGSFGGAFGGGSMIALGKLTGAGLNTDQIRSIAEIVFDHAKEHAGETLVNNVVGSIPGLGSYV
ncbi:MAG: DUF2267 domain-containing protein [Hyphomicrobiales bacterium]